MMNINVPSRGRWHSIKSMRVGYHRNLALLNILCSDLDAGVQAILKKFTDEITLGGEGRGISQRTNRLQTWVGNNKIRFSLEKFKSVHV